MKAIKGGKLPMKKHETDEILKSMAEMLKSSPITPKPNSTGISYSSLLLQLINPYQEDSKNVDIEELEYLLDMGTAGWNLAIYKMKNDFMYKNYLEAVTGEDILDEKSIALIHKMAADKEKLYGEYNDIIIEDFEIEEDKKGKAKVTVMAKSFDDFVAEAISDGFHDEEDEDFEFDEGEINDEIESYILPVVNRNAIFVKPKAPFIEWLRKVYFPEQPPVLEKQANIYMVPEYDTEKGTLKFIKNNFERIFCSELWAWDTDEKKWPSSRTYKMFMDWFETKPLAMMYDMVDKPLKKE